MDRRLVRRRRFFTESRRDVGCAPELVAEKVLVPGTWPEWQSEILTTGGPERVSVGDVVTGRARLLGFEVDGRSTTLEVEDSSYEQDVVVGVRMRVRYEVVPGPRGAVVTHSIASELPAGPLGGVLAFFLRRRLRRMQRDLLEKLAAQLESVDS